MQSAAMSQPSHVKAGKYACAGCALAKWDSLTAKGRIGSQTAVECRWGAPRPIPPPAPPWAADLKLGLGRSAGRKGREYFEIVHHGWRMDPLDRDDVPATCPCRVAIDNEEDGATAP